MPGAVVRVGAAVGDAVAAGQPLIWLEAMKMEHTIAAPSDGVLAELNVVPASRSTSALCWPGSTNRRSNHER